MLEDSEDDDIESVDITILPPEVGAGSDTDGDSDDEMVANGDPNSLSRNQLLAEACVQVRRRHGGTSTTLDLHEDVETLDEDEADAPAAPLPVKKAKGLGMLKM